MEISTRLRRARNSGGFLTNKGAITKKSRVQSIILFIALFFSACTPQVPTESTPPQSTSALSTDSSTATQATVATETEAVFQLPGGRLLFSAYLSEETRQPDPDTAEIFGDLAYYPWFAEYYWISLPDMNTEMHTLLTGLYPTRDRVASLAPGQSHIAFERSVHSQPTQTSSSVHVAEVASNESTQIGPSFSGDYVRASSWSLDGSAFAYWRAQDWEVRSFEGQHEIYVYQVASGAFRTITIETTQPITAALSTNGSQIAFAAFSETPAMHLINSDGSDQHLIVEGAIDWIAWHPDGTRIFYAQIDPQTGIFSYDLGSQEIKQITPSDTRRPLRPVLSPNGQWLAYDANGIYVISIDGGDPLQLTGGGLNQWIWSPDSQYLAYLAGTQVFVMDIQGNGRIAITPLELNADELIGWLP